MTGPVLSDVYNEAAFPTITYVEPREAQAIRNSLRTPGKHLTLIGASGSGKTTLTRRVFEELDWQATRDVHWLNGRAYSQTRSILDVFGEEFGEAPELSDITPWLRAFKCVV